MKSFASILSHHKERIFPLNKFWTAALIRNKSPTQQFDYIRQREHQTTSSGNNSTGSTSDLRSVLLLSV